jgi:hypothetical protein
MAYDFMTHNIWDKVFQQIEFDAKSEQAEKKS